MELRAAGVEVCFYQYSMPAWARGYFCLPRVDAAHLPADMRSTGGFVAGSVRFRVKVVPMGWAWAVFFIQAAHRHVQACTRVPSFWLQDKIPSPTVEAKVVARVLYIDNFATISVDADAGEAALEEMERALEAKGIIAHRDEPTAAGPPTLLGYQLDPARARWRIADKRFWRVKLALDWILVEGRRCTGKEIEKLLGHLTSILLLRRELLSLLHASYLYVSRSYLKRQPLWPSVREELRQARDLLPTIMGFMDLSWHATVLAVDASKTGFGVVEGDWPLDQVRFVGSLRERARFRGVLASSRRPREALYFEANGVGDERFEATFGV